MGYARYIGRIGALAVTLGVGVAVANTPGIAYAETTDSSTGAVSTDTNTSPTSPTDGSPGNQAPSSDPESPSLSDDESLDPHDPADDDPDVEGEEEAEMAEEAEEAEEGGETEVLPPAGGDEEVLPPAGGEQEPPETLVAQDSGSHRQSVDDDSEVQDQSGGSQSLNIAAVSEASNKVDSTIENGPSAQTQQQKFSISINNDPADAGSFASTFATTSVPITTTSTRPQPTWVTVVTEFVDAVVRWIQNPAGGSPLQLPTLTAALSLVRNELERALAPRTTTRVAQRSVTALEDPPAPLAATQTHVLVIGVDGANLSRILALDDTENEHFRALMATSTTGPGSIVGHTTISNPSWTAILTGAWGERTGVINNVFTAGTYNRFPTVFNQLEGYNDDIVTMAVGNWDVINAIAAAGSDPADHNLYVEQLAGDTNWLATDDMVADLTIDAITNGIDGEDPNFLFSYYVGVDENGHMYGGGSDQYELALENMDDNLGDIMQAITDSGEEWTVIVVTDHGHQAAQGFGHGFQSPDETETFVIAHGADFDDGFINTRYEIVDTTPTVVKLFGGTPRPGLDGVPLMDLGVSSAKPNDLEGAILAAIAQNHYPDALTNIALSARTIFATIPYLIYTSGHDIAQSMPSFLVVPVQLVMDALYVVTNIPAQIVAQLTGVYGASIFPLLPPPRPHFDPVDPPTLLLVRCGAPGAIAASSCGDAIVA